MTFVWDEPKRQANPTRHGFDLADFEDAFSVERFLTIDATQSETGRARFKLIGTWYGEVVVVAIVSPPGSEATAVVSVRRAHRTQRAAYAVP
ncbi:MULTISPECIES: BrnT family toxin [Methylobacterium]|jgi:uncharacterized DUF497 family protein|uniref:BrnT family toxin n=1 Tax=Methylobacterium TaxID=407 RepID=UPI0008EDF190|nr:MULTISPECIES: BrnT family toxin [Methylobacterium]MBZ6416230.1 BrnT family toxin [Methylobacterium sp.]MBK3399049.1 BrnT family toxin [Methylobacterium ajmalii]MBK3407379.1 BrnT family toxin [Methylobacterium ajmalii]MBK3426262.1 BrnT family toxin [Methylobacterium ajmalii]SFF79951.1 Ribonuclease toxin, BrnT, of type II toxin-antitoxin system [Methylobacterium sp. yr596]